MVNNIEEKVIQIIFDTLSRDDDYLALEKVTIDSVLVDDLGADSLTLTELVFEISDFFKIEISFDDLPVLITVKDVAEYVKKITTEAKRGG